MKAKQIYAVVNSIASQSLGITSITATDTTSLVSLGDVVLSSATDREKFYNALLDRIARTIYAIRSYEGKKRSIRRDPIEWGAVIQKISYEMSSAVNNPTWDIPLGTGEGEFAQSNPYGVTNTANVKNKLFKVLSTFSYEEVIPDVQLKTAFTSESAMGGFISGLYININNAMELAFENLDNLAVGTAIAKSYQVANAQSNPNHNIFRNLLAEYNTNVLGLTATASGTTITYPAGWLMKADALNDKDFLKYVSKTLGMTLDFISSFSTKFNGENWQRFTPKEKATLEVLSHLATSCEYYLEADTYHNTLVSLPNYEKVSHFQALGNGDFNDCSKINIKVGEDTIEVGGIIAFIHDVDMIATSIFNQRTNSIYNPRHELTTLFKKADIGYMVDMSENGIVFSIADPTATDGVVDYHLYG